MKTVLTALALLTPLLAAPASFAKISDVPACPDTILSTHDTDRCEVFTNGFFRSNWIPREDLPSLSIERTDANHALVQYYNQKDMRAVILTASIQHESRGTEVLQFNGLDCAGHPIKFDARITGEGLWLLDQLGQHRRILLSREWDRPRARVEKQC